MQVLLRPDLLDLPPDSVSLSLLRLAAWHTDPSSSPSTSAVDPDDVMRTLSVLEDQVRAPHAHAVTGASEMPKSFVRSNIQYHESIRSRLIAHLTDNSTDCRLCGALARAVRQPWQTSCGRWRL